MLSSNGEYQKPRSGVARTAAFTVRGSCQALGTNLPWVTRGLRLVVFAR